MVNDHKYEHTREQGRKSHRVIGWLEELFLTTTSMVEVKVRAPLT